MLKAHVSAVLLSILLLSVSSSSQEPAKDPESVRIANGIQEGSWSEILKAGESGDPNYVPQLQALIKYRKINPETRIYADMALAKLGDNDALKQTYCELVNGGYEDVERVFIRKLPYIGGWFSVQLTDDVISGRIDRDPVPREHSEDQAVIDIRSMAAHSATKWLPGLKDRLVGEREWKQYLESNRYRLMLLEPRATDLLAHRPNCRGK